MDRWRQDGAGAVRGRGAAQVHMAGVAGRGMAGLAQMLVQRGFVVTGSEPSPGPAVDRLRELGVRVHVHAGETPRLGPRSARWLIRGTETVTGRSRLDRLVDLRRGRDVRTPGECLGALMRQGIGLAVTGGRSASVAAAMIGWTLTRAGLDPTLVLGTSAPQLGGWGRHGGGPHVVVEAVPGEDWARLAPRLAVLLEDEAATGEGPRVGPLRELAESMPEAGRVLAQAGHPTAEAALRGYRGAVEWLSLDRAADWWGADLREHQGRFRFRAFERGRFVVEVRLRMPGRRHVLGALAAVAICARLDVPVPLIQQALEEFVGISRDFESRGSYRGVTLIDDESHDPASIREALDLGRRLFGGRRLWAVLRAPSTRAYDELDQYTAALGMADEVVLADPRSALNASTRASESLGPGASEADRLAKALATSGVRARRVASLDDAILELDRHLEPGDVLVTLGAGDVGTISDAFIRRLPRDRPGR